MALLQLRQDRGLGTVFVSRYYYHFVLGVLRILLASP